MVKDGFGLTVSVREFKMWGSRFKVWGVELFVALFCRNSRRASLLDGLSGVGL